MSDRAYAYTDADGQSAAYVDRKRWWWLLSVAYPLFPLYAVALHAASGQEWLLLHTGVVHLRNRSAARRVAGRRSQQSAGADRARA